jgi:hypothetical protein
MAVRLFSELFFSAKMVTYFSALYTGVGKGMQVERPTRIVGVGA